MAELVICEGGSELQLEPSEDSTFFYRIGSCAVSGREVIEINDSVRLNTIATEIRDEYSQWIYSINKLFLRNKLVSLNLSLFFLTDLSEDGTDGNNPPPTLPLHMRYSSLA